ncbi:MAG TPA: CDP-alcohol phosphatidyltransferase family protein, partial [Candidatus Thermoplasmatota archaeon]|nr:CDP-alcohol phosphatidyltransferase family protein [Candidatus Thermoplasmatota archaeon]
MKFPTKVPNVRLPQRLLRRRLRLKRFRSIISPADLFTLTNAFSGFLAIAVLSGQSRFYDSPVFPQVFPGLTDPFLVASALIGVGLVCDALDGMVARKFGGSQLGGDLDTLADAITFVAAPALMVVTYYGNNRGTLEMFPAQALLAAGLVLVMGILRLARFNANPTESETKTFQGLPTPWCAISVVLLVLTGTDAIWALPAIAILAFLMMSSVAYPKSKGRMVPLALAVVGVGVFVIATILFFPATQGRVLRGALILVTLLIALGPFLLSRFLVGKAGEGTTAPAPEAGAAPPG